MKPNNKIYYIGAGILAIGAYFYFKNKTSSSSFDGNDVTQSTNAENQIILASQLLQGAMPAASSSANQAIPYITTAQQAVSQAQSYASDFAWTNAQQSISQAQAAISNALQYLTGPQLSAANQAQSILSNVAQQVGAPLGIQPTYSTYNPYLQSVNPAVNPYNSYQSYNPYYSQPVAPALSYNPSMYQPAPVYPAYMPAPVQATPPGLSQYLSAAVQYLQAINSNEYITAALTYVNQANSYLNGGYVNDAQSSIQDALQYITAATPNLNSTQASYANQAGNYLTYVNNNIASVPQSNSGVYNPTLVTNAQEAQLINNENAMYGNSFNGITSNVKLQFA